MSDLQACFHKPTPPTHSTLFQHVLKVHNLVREFGIKNELLYCYFPKRSKNPQH